MFQRGWFHIDVKQEEMLSELLPLVGQYGPTRNGALTAQVIEELTQPARFAGVIVQLDADNAPRLQSLFDSMPNLPVLVLLNVAQRHHINALSARGASCAITPIAPANLINFVQRALSHNFVPNQRVASTIVQLASKRALTPREVQLVSYCLGDEPRSRVRRRLGITENTLKSQIRGLLRKCGERNMDALAKNVLRTSLLSYALPDTSGETTQESSFGWLQAAE